MSNVIIKVNILVIEGIFDSVLSLPFLNIYVGIFIYRMQVATKRLSFPASIAGARMMYDVLALFGLQYCSEVFSSSID